ncbi:MAG: hypothetical protein ACJ8FY_05495 [Gemmataceae bacterium]
MKPSAINAVNFESALEHYRPGRDDEEACTDLITDAMHFMAFNFLNISTVLWRARMHFDAEAAVVTDESVGAECYRPIVGSSITSRSHSPAPWGYEYSSWTIRSEHDTRGVGAEIPAYEIFDANGDKVFDTNETTPADLQEANACLATAAPRLLASLITCATLLADFDESDGEEGEAYREALAAIAEATGRPA